MLWQEDESQEESVIPQSVVDLSFKIECRCLPVDHAHALSIAISKILPWFEEEQQAGLHLIHGAESGNGWDSPADFLYLSRRTKLILRLPQHRLDAAQALTGITLDIAGYSLKVGAAKQKLLNKTPVLFARHVVANPEQDEDAFLDHAVLQMQKMGIECRKALCGKNHRFKLPERELFTRSLMIADLKPQESIDLQEQGLGEGRKMGCGLFVPHKDIKTLKPTADK